MFVFGCGPQGCLTFFFRMALWSLFSPTYTREQEAAPQPRRRERLRQRAQRSIPSVVERVAAKVRGTVLEGAEHGMPEVHFEIHGMDTLVQWGMNKALTRVFVNVTGHSPGMVKIYPHAKGVLVRSHFSGREVPPGHPAYDERFVILSDPEALVGEIFGSHGRESLWRVLRRVPRWWECHIDLTPRTLVLSLPAVLTTAPAVMTLVRLATEIVVRMRQGERSGKLQVVETTSGSEGECQVCGTALSGALIRCRRCHTPHHDDCWEYMERCSTFGCNETRTTR